MNNRVFKISISGNTKKRIYTSLEDFNRFGVNHKIQKESTLYRYNKIYGRSNVRCSEKIDGKWKEIYPIIGFDYE